ncbi:MAG: hypothetical protein HYU51_01200 [Candidatus Rokubacteria bacterium]|nr:hypothetical protein [Candidatus Rokubacteria bacterium]
MDLNAKRTVTFTLSADQIRAVYAEISQDGALYPLVVEALRAAKARADAGMSPVEIRLAADQAEAFHDWAYRPHFRAVAARIRRALSRELFVDEPNLIARGLSERDFTNGEVLDGHKRQRLDELIASSSLFDARRITVEIRGDRQGIYLIGDF